MKLNGVVEIKSVEEEAREEIQAEKERQAERDRLDAYLEEIYGSSADLEAEKQRRTEIKNASDESIKRWEEFL